MEFRTAGGGLLDLETVAAENVPEDIRARFDAALAAQRNARDTDAAARELVKEIDADTKARNDFATKFAPRFQRTRLQEVRAMIASSRPYIADLDAVPRNDHVEEAGAPRDQDGFLSMVRQQDSAILGKQHALRDLSTKLRKERERVKVCERALMTAHAPQTHRQALMEVSETARRVASGEIQSKSDSYQPLCYLDALGQSMSRGTPEDFARSRFQRGGFRRGASPVKKIPRFGIGDPKTKAGAR